MKFCKYYVIIICNEDFAKKDDNMIRRIFRWALILVVVILLSMYIPYYVNTCVLCGNLFVGVGYKANDGTDFFDDKERVLCKDCAETYHGSDGNICEDVSQYQNPIFVDPVTLFSNRLNIKEDRSSL